MIAVQQNLVLAANKGRSACAYLVMPGRASARRGCLQGNASRRGCFDSRVNPNLISCGAWHPLSIPTIHSDALRRRRSEFTYARAAESERVSEPDVCLCTAVTTAAQHSACRPRA